MSDFGPLIISVASKSLRRAEKSRLQNPAVGGVLLFGRNYRNKEQLDRLTAEIKAIDETLIITVDHEGGVVQRLRAAAFTHLPAARKLGLYYDDDADGACRLAEACGTLAGSELKSAGIDCGFCPVLDIYSAHSTVIGSRAYHPDAAVISRLAAAFIRGLHRNGIISVGKHYPGHGLVAGDTHTDRVVDSRPLRDLENQDMLPYAQLIQQNLLDAVMMAHIVYPALDGVPASLSKRWMTESLRDTLQFDGLIFSDDISMQAIDTALLSAQRMLDAGCDMIIACHENAVIDRLIAELAACQLDRYRERIHIRWQTRQRRMAQTGADGDCAHFDQTRVALQQLEQRYRHTPGQDTT